MKGQVKWFSREKGYGFITSDSGEDHYFTVRDVKGADLPSEGDTVKFEGYKGDKGPRARNVLITARISTGRDDRVRCRHCEKQIVPRIITDRRPITHAVRISRTVCPFCGGTIKDFRCFIATAVYGSADDSRVIAFRSFRDRHLLRTSVGRMATVLYYAVSPPIAAFLARHPWATRATQVMLDAVARHIPPDLDGPAR